MMNDVIENALKATIEGLLESITSETECKIPINALNTLKDSYMTKNASNYSVCVAFQLEEVFDALTKKIIPEIETYPKNIQFEMSYLWKNFNRVSHYISEFISKYEGRACSVDQSNWLLNSYMNYLKTKELPDMTITEKCFWKPHFGSARLWMEWISGYIMNDYRPSFAFFENTEILRKEGEMYKEKKEEV